MGVAPAVGEQGRVLTDFDPIIADWFAQRFAAPTAPQLAGWPLVRSGEDVLICAPTGSGKTLAAFLICLDRLVREARNGLADRTQVLYISPLKALTNDVQKNLQTPLAEMQVLAVEHGAALAPIRVALRHGDTLAHERRRMLVQTPHVLVTTPESLFILLTAAKSRQMLRTVSTVIVDEIHAVADDKRGSHLGLSLARLDDLVAKAGGAKPQRIGLSATVEPINEVARFMSPGAKIVDIGHRRDMHVSVEVPKDELGPVASSEMWAEIYDRLVQLIAEHRTTLIFVNTRRLAERVAHALCERLGDGAVLPHHGSLARLRRMRAEARLKSGELRAVVATASLELGIDIGTIDLVVQLGTPRCIAVALQRFGRSGHWVGARPKGIFIATTRDELLECAALVRAIRQGSIDRLEIPRAPLDILAQQIVAMCATDDWEEDRLFELVRSTYSYAQLPRAGFDAVVSMLADGVATARGRAGTFLHRDRVNGRVRGRRGARLAAITCGGAIPDTTTYSVIAEPDGTPVGTLDEDFAIESLVGDIFLLGVTSWRIRRVEPGRVRVEDAHGAPPSIPFWNGEAPGRTVELSREVSDLREAIARGCAEQGRAAALEMLAARCGLDRLAGDQAIDYVLAGQAMLGVVPAQHTVVAERFFDEGGGMQLVLHAPFGARVNRAWGLALRKRFCRSFNLELQAAATDNGIVISLSEQHAFPLEIVFEFSKAANVEHVLTQAMLPAPMFTARWRWNACRALAILRFLGGRRVPAALQRMRSDDLIAAVFPDVAACPENLSGDIRIPDHPLVNETIANCLHEAMDVDGLKTILRGIECGQIRTVALDVAEPSPFSHEILNANPYAYLDDAPLEERRARAVQLRRTLRSDVSDGSGILEPAAIAQVGADSWPVVRDADELHDALLSLVVAPPQTAWQPFFERLVRDGLAAELRSSGDCLWVAAERLAVAQVAYLGGVLVPQLAPPAGAQPAPESSEAAATEIVRGWLECTGPSTTGQLAERLRLAAPLVEAALLRLESQGQVLRGRFSGRTDLEWCNRRVLARIHRLTLGTLRREIEPVTAVQFVTFLCRWQHVAPGTQLHGVDGTYQVIRQLQGYEIPAAAWEAQVLPRRVSAYRGDLLDQLCRTGDVMWGRLSPHPALTRAGAKRSRRIAPSKMAPISIFLREDAEWLTARKQHAASPLSQAARDVVHAIGHRGALFFIDILRATRRLPSEVERALWELTAAGLVTADGFDNLRSLINRKRRLGEGRHRMPRDTAGRWALLHEQPPAAVDADDARAARCGRIARQLLSRWGVVFRDILAREALEVPWRDLLVALRKLEATGEIRGGRFVSGFAGEQFALPEAVDLLRSLRRAGQVAQPVELSAFDPLNLMGIILPGSKISAATADTVRLSGGAATSAAV